MNVTVKTSAMGAIERAKSEIQCDLKKVGVGLSDGCAGRLRWIALLCLPKYGRFDLADIKQDCEFTEQESLYLDLWIEITKLDQILCDMELQ